MTSLLQIARSWYNFYVATPETKHIMSKRLEVCDKCEHKVQVSEAGKILIQAVNEEASVYQCGVCHCPLAAKTAHPMNECPLGKWKIAGEESYF